MQRVGIEVRLAGTPRWLSGDAGAGLDRKAAGLLALVAVDGPLLRGRAAALLWPAVARAQALGSLRQLLLRLQRRCGAVLVAERDALVFAAGVGHDLVALQAPLAESGSPGLLEGLAFDDCPEFADWLAAARERRRQDFLAALAATVTHHEQAGALHAAIDAAARLVREDPLREQSHRRLMRLHHQRGDRAAALAAYRELERLLREQLQVEPSAETLALLHALDDAPAALRSEPPRHRPLPASVLRPPRTVGRDGVLRHLLARWSVALPTVLSGEPGIGKTRLVEELSGQVPAAVRVGCRPGDDRVAHLLLSRLLSALAGRWPPPQDAQVAAELARFVPEYGAPATWPAEPARLRLALQALLAALRPAGLAGIVIDDSHYADEPSLELLLSLAVADGLPGLPWVFAVRSSEVPRALQHFLSQRADTAQAVCAVEPLTEDDVCALFDTLQLGLDSRAWAAALHRRAGGNPFFLLETLRATLGQAEQPLGAEPPATLPSSVRLSDLIQERLARLTPAGQQLLQVAALAGPDFNVGLACELTRRSALDLALPWAELEQAQVLDRSGFAHDLLLEAALQRVPIPIRAALHRGIADHLERHAGDPLRTAGHWQQAGDPLRAGRQYRAAAARLAAQSRRDEEGRLLDQAIACFEAGGDPRSAFAARLDAVRAAVQAGGVEAALPHLALLDRDAEDDRQQLDALMARTDVELFRGDMIAAGRGAREALPLARRLGLPEVEFNATRAHALALCLEGQPQAAIDALDQVEAALGSQVRDDRLRFEFHSARAYALHSAGQRRAVLPEMHRALELACRIGDRHETVTTLTNLAGQHGYLGNARKAAELCEDARRIHRQLGEAQGITAVNDLNLAGHCLALGRYGEALQLLEQSATIFPPGGQQAWTVMTELTLAQLWLRLGQPQRALRALQTELDTIPAHIQARRWLVEYRVRAALAPNGPPDLLHRIVGRLAGEAGGIGTWVLASLELLRRDPGLDGAARCAELGAQAGAIDYVAGRLLAELVRAECMARAGDVAAAAVVAQGALAGSKEVSHTELYPPEFALRAGELSLSLGDEAGAAAALDYGIDWLKHDALPNVPAELREAFLRRQAVNVALVELRHRFA